MTSEPTGVLAEFSSQLTLDAIPDDVRASCKTLILDALACALAGHQGEETGQLTAMAAALGQSTESSVFGGTPLTLAGATMLNGYLITAVTMCDVHRATLTHITPEVIPPAFAIAERCSADGGACGRDAGDADRTPVHVTHPRRAHERGVPAEARADDADSLGVGDPSRTRYSAPARMSPWVIVSQFSNADAIHWKPWPLEPRKSICSTA